MHAWLKQKLTDKGFEVVVPKMPGAETPHIEPWLAKMKEVVGVPDEQTYFIGHSIGCQAVLRYLTTLPEQTKVAGVFLIAPWMFLDDEAIAEDGEEASAIQKEWESAPLDWNKLKNKTKNFICQFSDNDPFVLLEKNKELFAEKINAEILIDNEKGHFTEDDGVTENQRVVDWFVKLK